MRTLAPVILVIMLAVSSANSGTCNYIGNKNTKKFHETTCWTLPKEENGVYFNNREDAIAENYNPCGNCNP